MRSRRQLLGQVGLAAAGLFGLGQVGALSISPARGQGKSSAPFRILRARAGATLSGSEEKASGSLLGYDGAVPGPVLRAKHGEEIRLRLFNELAEATSLHCHGVRLPNAMDGVPDLTQSALVPGAHFDYQLLPPDAGTFWYHAHSAGQVDRGLYGALVVEERSPVDVDREIVLVLGMPDPGQSQPREHVLVNGAVRPDIALQSGERVRLRLINATAARGTTLRIDGHVPWIMAIDGQPAEPFLPRDNRVGIAPGGRVDLFLDATANPGAMVALVSGADYAIARFVYQAGRGPERRRGQPAPLPDNALPARIALETAMRADVTIGDAKTGADAKAGAAPAGDDPRAFLFSMPPLFTVRRGRAVSLALHNRTRQAHVAHVHGHHFRLLDRLDDGWKPYWLDTLVVSEAVERIAFVADSPGKWLIEWRMLDRPDSGSSVWFAVS